MNTSADNQAGVLQDQSEQYNNEQQLTFDNTNHQYPYECVIYNDYNAFFDQGSTNNFDQVPIRITLEDQDLWIKFNSEKNEMMVYARGRELFPKLSFVVTGLIEHFSYIVGLKLVRRSVNPMRYSTLNPIGWSEDKRSTGKGIVDPESNEIFMDAMTGNDIMKKGLNWKNAKIFNIADPKKSKTTPSQTMLTTMLRVHSHHQYTPVVTIYDAFSKLPVASAYFEETTFIVVTKYKNKNISSLKSTDNKFCRNDLQKKAETKTKQSSPTASLSPPTNLPCSMSSDQRCNSVPVYSGINANALPTPSPSLPTSSEQSPIEMPATTSYYPNFQNSEFTPNIQQNPDNFVPSNNAYYAPNYHPQNTVYQCDDSVHNSITPVSYTSNDAYDYSQNYNDNVHVNSHLSHYHKIAQPFQ